MPVDASHHLLTDRTPEPAPPVPQSLLARFRDFEVPLTKSGLAGPTPELMALAGQSAAGLFPRTCCPEGVMAGLLLSDGDWKTAHELVDHLTTPDGCYWHAIIHRMEPDIGNSDYWFRQVRQHSLFPSLLAAARQLASANPEARLRLDQEWNPAVFNSWCDQARKSPHTPKSLLIAQIHSAECHLLWNYSLEKVRGPGESS